MKTETIVYFLLTDFQEDPEEISLLLSISPSKTWKVGDLRIPKSILCHESNGWRLNSNMSDSEELEKHVRGLLEQLKPCWKKLIELTTNCYAQLSCVIYIYDFVRPAIHFDLDIIQKLTEIHTAIDVDLYILDKTEE